LALCKCDYCGKPFNSVGTKLCAECMQLVDEAYVKVRKYIYQNSDKADFSSIVENTEVAEKALSYLINEGRIVIENGGGRGVRCRACGTSVLSGVLCQQCKQKLISEKLMSGANKYEKPEKKTAGSKIQPLLHGPQN